MKAIYLPLIAASLFANVAFAKVNDRDVPPEFGTVIKTTAQQDAEYASSVREHEGKGDRNYNASPIETESAKKI
jgi:hypothetical protein